MWTVDNHSPFAAKGTFARDQSGEEFWVVAVRGIFRVSHDGLAEICDEQRDVRLAPEYDESHEELLSESDIAPFRLKTDIVLSGSACAIASRPVASQGVSVAVGKLRKRAIVHGKRVARKQASRLSFRSRWIVEDHEKFLQVPLRWREAFGGKDPFAPEPRPHAFNPIGTGWSNHLAAADEGSDLAMPRIENPLDPYFVGASDPRPHCFGPIQRSWRPRIEYAGTFDDEWRTKRAPLLPANFSQNFYQSVSTDQIYPGLIVGGEPVTVTGTNPQGVCTFRLPQVILIAKTRLGTEQIASRFKLISVDINGTSGLLEMVWNAAVPCTGSDHLVRGSSVLVKQMSGIKR